VIDRSGDLRAAFFRESSAVLPGILWREAVDGVSVEYPQDSPTLGTLTVGFGGDEIMVFVGPRGFHAHFSIGNPEAPGPSDQVTEAARTAVFFVRDIIEDRLSIRWGVLVSGARSSRRGASIVGRVWKWLTPWVRDAVWSGRA
jgi:hypothetical protein